MNNSAMAVLLAASLVACGSGDSEVAAVPAAVPAATPAAADALAVLEDVSADKTIAGRRGDGGSNARDPGPRAAPAGAGAPLNGLTTLELAAFEIGKEDFSEAELPDEGLGPTMNLDSCAGCHMQPNIGGTSPALNPQVAFAGQASATNVVPPFITMKGPVREARFVRNPDGSPDGGVHALFTIAGRTDAVGCKAQQPDFAAELARRNVIFRIPTPVFGAGLIEQIPDRAILANMASQASAKSTLGISGRGNRNGNDGTIARFGWKAQNKSLLVFSGEAYNVEMGITNDLFQTERDETGGCQFAAHPNSVTDLAAATTVEAISSIEKFTAFMKLLAPPTPSTDTPGGRASIVAGRVQFDSIGCGLCHTPTLRTGNATVKALRNQDVNLFSDLLLHDMGAGLADGIAQGQASGREFRTSPLWGLGQRLFFLHDGRTADLRQAVLAHQSDGSEANGVISRFTRLADREQQDLLNFLRSL